MANVALLGGGKVMRCCPIPAGGSAHVPLAIVDELRAGTEVTVAAAGEGSATLILDIGILEVHAFG